MNGNFETPESEYLTFERMDHIGHSRTYNVDFQVADGASAATALFSGVKTKRFTLGYDYLIDNSDPDSTDGATELETILDWAQAVGKSTGFVTTGRVTDGSTAALYGHSYNPATTECDNSNLAYQMIKADPGMSTNVIMGGGYNAFVPADSEMPDRPNLDDSSDWNCANGQNLIDEWQADHPNKSSMVTDVTQLNNVNAAETDYLLGLFARADMSFDDKRDDLVDPSLSQMVDKAIEILQKNEDGFLLVVTNPRIDSAHDATQANRALSETVALDIAVEKALEAMGDKLDKTLIVVTADHSNTMTMSGYPTRAADIAGLNGEEYDDDLPYTTLSYADGPEFERWYEVDVDQQKVVRKDLTQESSSLKSFDSARAVIGPKGEGSSHGGDDVAIYAQGPMSHLFHKTHEQTYVAYVIANSACIGQYDAEDARCSQQGQGMRRSEESITPERKEVEDVSYWQNLGFDEVTEAKTTASAKETKIAKNIAIFIGDGMSIPTLAASRIFKAQHNNSTNPESELLTFETLPHFGHSKTYDINYQVPDSAATASAMYSGVKTIGYSMGYDSSIDHDDPSSMLPGEAQEVTTVFTWAQEAGKSTGFVTSTEVTHATPGALYAHSYDRNFACDADLDLVDTPEGVHDIAWQLVNREPGSRANVMLGGGYAHFVPEGTAMPPEWDRPELDTTGGRREGNLIEDWKNLHANDQWAFVQNKQELNNVDAQMTDYLFGTFGPSHMPYAYEFNTTYDPSLADMTGKATEILKKNDNGFFLMVEAGHIDKAHHDTQANKAMYDVMAFDHAIEEFMNLMGDEMEDTLIIVTADHGHTMSFGSYASRGSNIMGFADDLLDDGLPRTILNYANGRAFPGGGGDEEHFVVIDAEVKRANLSELYPGEELYDMERITSSTAPTSSETHGGSDVGIFSAGPMSHLFHTTHEQTHIAHVMAYSACIGPYADEDRCRSKSSGAAANSVALGAWLVTLSFALASYQRTAL